MRPEISHSYEAIEVYLHPWQWRQYVPLKRLCLAEVHIALLPEEQHRQYTGLFSSLCCIAPCSWPCSGPIPDPKNPGNFPAIRSSRVSFESKQAKGPNTLEVKENLCFLNAASFSIRTCEMFHRPDGLTAISRARRTLCVVSWR
jgi:hypothetical protein